MKNLLSEKLRKRYRYNEAKYRFMKSSIIFWVTYFVFSALAIASHYL